MAVWTRNSGAMSTSNRYIKYRTKVVLNSQNIANNTSNVTVSVEVWRTNSGYTTRGTGTAYLTIDGTNYSSSIASSQLFTHNSYTQVISKTVNISHGSNGAKNLGVSARISHSQFSSNSQSYSTSLNTIPRASSLSAFSFASQLQPSTAITINYTVDRKSDGFRHQIKLLDGSHEVQVWDNISSHGASSLKLSTASVNSLLKRMSSVTSKSLTLRVATRSGVNGGWVGSAVTRNANINVHSSVAPTISGLSISQTGNSVSGHTLQGISRITASFTRSAGYDASISSNTITVRRKGNNDDVQTINSYSGTTGRAVTHSGTYQAQGMVKDSRGRTAYTEWTDISVEAYSPPRITTFTATRNEDEPEIVNVVRNTIHTNLGTDNPLTYRVQRRQGTGAWTNVNTSPTGSYTTSPLTNGSSTSTGNSVTFSYEFRLVVTDKFGESAESIVTVPTQRVVLDIHKNEGVGIGKIHEKGVLDVDGEAYFRGNIELAPKFGAGRPGFKLISQDPSGHGYLEFFGPDNTRRAYIGIPNKTDTKLNIYNQQDDLVNFWGSDVAFANDPIVGYGSNSNGEWVKFYNGVMIVWGDTVILTNSGTGNHKFGTANFPANFINNSYSVSLVPWAGGIANFGAHTYVDPTTNSIGIWVTRASTASTRMKYIAIGRWK